ncbi:hypothetical protein [Gemmatimonas sp.]|uniref:hypothetical protein n=1 Tax=Gemmatimonas sp. TaxID=1962908 RepID=UPI00286B09E5|nr:hypothetical protein [Gemmatimonas sp.]
MKLVYFLCAFGTAALSFVLAKREPKDHPMRGGYYALAVVGGALSVWKLLPDNGAITFKLLVMVPITLFVVYWGMRTYFRAAARRDAQAYEK